MTSYELDIELVVGGGKLPRPIDLDELKKNLDGHFKTFGDQPGLYFALEEDNWAVTFYGGDKDGAPYIVRANTVQKLVDLNNEVLGKLVDIGVLTEDESDEMDLEKYNHVANGHLNKDLNLATLTLALRSYDENQQLESKVEYEPEQFPPIVYLGPESPCKSLIFSNGKIVVPGGKTKQECAETFRLLVNELADRFPSKFDRAENITFST